MEVSVIIPTYKREKDLNECLNSIIIQTNLPKEVIVVDNNNDGKTENLISNLKNEFGKHGVLLRYIKNQRENSLTAARNIGIKNSIGDIILFLDDDIILEKNYIEEILKIYEKYSKALGVQGYITIKPFKTISFLKLVNLFGKIFFLGYLKKNECKVLPSISSSYPYLLDKIISCQCLSGANNSYKRLILERFKCDEKLKKYSEGEDIDLSYRIFKEHPNSLFLTPYAKCIHKVSKEGRIPQKELIYMQEVYPLYLFYKIIDQSFKNKVIYLWSRIGRLIFNTLVAIFKYRLNFKLISYRIGALFYCSRHFKEIKKGNLEFFNKTLK